MLEMLLEALAEILGLETRPPQQRRQTGSDSGTAGQRSAQRRDAAPRTTMQREDQYGERTPSHGIPDIGEMVRRVMGLDEQEETAPPPPEPEKPRRQRQAPAPRMESRRIEAATPTTYAPPRALPVEKAAAPSKPRSPAAQTASRLRANPAAAREAFIYAEIFGPPLADR